MKGSPKAKSILLLRPDAIGDSILFSGTLKWYRKLYEGWTITLAVQEINIPLLENCPYVDRLIDFKTLSFLKTGPDLYSRGISRIRKVSMIFTKIFRPRFDLIVCPARSVTPESLWIVQHTRGNERIGIVGCPSNFGLLMNDKKKKVFDRYFSLTDEKIWQHEFDTHIDFLRYLGSDVSSSAEIQPIFWFKPPTHLEQKFTFLNSNEPYTVLIPYVKDAWREVSEDIYVELAKKYAAQTVIVIGTGNDQHRAQELTQQIEQIGKMCINLCGKSSIAEMVYLIEKSDSVISVETAGLHIAIAKKKKVFAIVGGGHWGRFFPYEKMENVTWLNQKMDCYTCDWTCKYNDHRCVSNFKDGVL